MKPRGFERRYVFKGTLVLKTGLHVGSGWATGSPSDNPIIRTPDGSPFIPGSSFKGAFRSTVEKLALTIGLNGRLKTCSLDHENEDSTCLTPQRSKLGEAFRTLRNYQNQIISSKRDEEGVKALERVGHKEWSDNHPLTEDSLLFLLDEHLCDTCKLFGSPYIASHITFADLLPPKEDDLADKMVQIRDGVVIDRDSEKAVDRLKYDYEVVAPSQTFEMQIVLDNPSDTDLALTCLGLNEFVSGFGYIGGKRSRGLANCQIEGLNIYELDLRNSDKRAERLKKYVLNKTLDKKMTRLPNVESFLEQQIELLL